MDVLKFILIDLVNSITLNLYLSISIYNIIILDNNSLLGVKY